MSHCHTVRHTNKIVNELKLYKFRLKLVIFPVFFNQNGATFCTFPRDTDLDLHNREKDRTRIERIMSSSICNVLRIRVKIKIMTVISHDQILMDI